MGGAKDKSSKRLADEVRRQFDSPSARRYFRSLPLFRTSDRMPDYFDELLARLDEASGQVRADG